MILYLHSYRSLFKLSYKAFERGDNLKNKKIFSTFFREKPAMMLIHLKNSSSEVYASSLAKTVDCTYSHVVKILQEMEKYNIINFKKQGRLKIIQLTNKGQKIADNIDTIRVSL